MTAGAATPARYFVSVFEAFQQAERAAGGAIVRSFSIAGQVVRLRFAGPGLLSAITPALEHHTPASSSTPDLTICLWDSASTGADLPAAPWLPKDWARGEIWRFDDERLHMISLSSNRLLSALDKSQNLAIYWTPAADQIPWYESGSPLLVILNWWMAARNLYLVHAGAVGMPDKGVLLVGAGGAGKSTTALACLNGGLAFASDDHALISVDPVPQVYSLYSSAKVDGADVDRFPNLKPALTCVAGPDGERGLYFLCEHFRDKVATGFPVRAVLMPKVTGRRETSLVSASPTEALKAVAPSTLFMVQGTRRSPAAFDAMIKLVEQVPCYHLNLGTDLTQIPGAVQSVLSGT